MAGKREKVVVAMSGGVDSSVAACLLIEQGYDVIGLFMRVGAVDPPRAAGGMESRPVGSLRERSEGDDATHADVTPGGMPHACVGMLSDAPADDTSYRAPSASERDGEQEKNPLPDGRGSGKDASSQADQSTTSDTSRRLPTGRDSIPPAARAHQGCCSASDAADARFVAGMLHVPFYALNFQADFDKIIDYFADEYVNGRTPNPCVVCNDKLKFGRVVDYADAIGAKYIATGHYARIGERHGQRVLMCGRDEKKDQSYVLFGLEREILDRVLFPVGELTKGEVRVLAERFNLPNRNKPDSVDICFVPDRDYARVVKERRPEAFVEGDVLDGNGATIGRHYGVANYTVGQRRGLGIAAGKPIYVTQLNVADNTVTMGTGDDLLETALIAGRANFLIDPPDGPFRAEVKIRYLHKAAPATVEVLRGSADPADSRGLKHTAQGSGGMPHASVDMSSGSPEWSTPLARAPGSDMPTRVRVVFDEPQRAITPGQAVVFYDGEVVLGGAWIEGAVSAACSSYYSKKEALI